MTTRTGVIAGAFVLAFIAGFCSSASAQQSETVKSCMNEEKAPPDLQIGGCTAAIQSGRWQGKDLAWAFSNRGVAYAAKGQFDRAIQDYDQAIRLNPNYANVFYNRGNAYDDKGEYDRGIQDYDQAIRLNPNYAKAFFNRGVAYHKKGDYNRAIQDYDQATKLDPNDADTLYNRSLAKDKKGDKVGAVADMAAARRINPNVGQ